MSTSGPRKQQVRKVCEVQDPSWRLEVVEGWQGLCEFSQERKRPPV